MIIGASPETDYHIINLSAALYKKYELKRVFYTAYMPVVAGKDLPALDTKPQLLREHRLYQADWLLRFYKFDATELLDEKNPNFNLLIDPKCNWALNHYDYFPLEVNTAPYEALLRAPGLGEISVQKILKARRMGTLDFIDLRKMGVVLKRAQYFIICKGKAAPGIAHDPESVLRGLLSEKSLELARFPMEQLSLFDDGIGSQEPSLLGLAPGCLSTKEDLVKCITGQM